MSEYNLELDDVRWYCCITEATVLLTYQGKLTELATEMWSGRLGDRLLDMEEGWLKELADRWNGNVGDEMMVRQALLEVKAAQRRRRRPQAG